MKGRNLQTSCVLVRMVWGVVTALISNMGALSSSPGQDAGRFDCLFT